MIEKITDQNLERYDSRLKEWCDRKFFEKGNYGKYQTTEESGAVAFYPVPNTPLEGKVKFSFKETMPASGDKGSENPSTISGVSEVNVTRCGKNIALLPFADSTNTNNGIIFTNNNDGSITVNGTATSNSYFIFRRNIYLHAGAKLSINAEISGTDGEGVAVQIISRDSLYSIIWQYLNEQNTIKTIPEDGYVTLRLYIGKNKSLSNVVIKPQCEFGDAKTDYEAPILASEADYTLPLGSTYYGGEIDLATGVMTVTWEEVSDWNPYYVDGTSYTDVVLFRQGLPHVTKANNNNNIDKISCNMLAYNGTTPTNIESYRVYGSNREIIQIALFKNRFSGMEEATNDQWKAAIIEWISNNNLRIVYELDVPQTVQLSPVSIYALTQVDKYTPRLNTVYTDADSVQISYLKSPIRDEYEKTQAILSLGGNS